MSFKKKLWLIAHIYLAFFLLVDGDHDSSGNHCWGCISNKTLVEIIKWPHITGNNTSHFLCLKDCVQQSCHHDGERSMVKYNAKLYNLTGIIFQLGFNEFIKQKTVAKVDFQILLCERGKFVKDPKILDIYYNTSTTFNCSVYGYQVTGHRDDLSRRKIANILCSKDFVFNNVGVTIICIGNLDTGKTNNACNIIKVLAPLEIPRMIPITSRYPLQTFWKVKIKGSVSKLLYEFGDGHGQEKSLIEPVVYKVCVIRISFGHNYTFPGTYNFTISARNPLESLEKSMIIKHRLGITLSTEVLVSDKSKVVLLIKAKHHPTGMKLKYGFKFHPSTSIIASETPEPSARKLTLVKPYMNRIMVNVTNKDGIELGSKNIRIQVGNLLNQISKVRCAETHVQTGKELTCHLVYNSATKLTINWIVNGKKVSNRSQTFRHVFNKAGKYNISVTNFPVQHWLVIVKDPINNLTIVAPPTITAGLLVTFKAFAHPSDNVAYNWYFGDGVSLNNDGKNSIDYLYQRSGDYKLTVIANNNVNAITKSITINVTTFCVNLDSSFNNGSEVDVFRSHPIHLELGITYSKCNQPVKVSLNWKLFEENGTSGWNSVALKNQNINKSTFGIYIPSCVLQYKRYKFIVSAVITLDKDLKYPKKFVTIIKIISTPLKAVIRGGFVRYVSNMSDTVTMDGTISTDPDYPSSQNLKYSWTCISKPLNSSCFQVGNPLKNAGVIVEIPLSTFKYKGSPFLFHLVVSGHNRGSKSTFQFMYIDTLVNKNIILDCISCNDGIVNPSKPIVIIRRCASCDVTRKGISWPVRQFGDEFLISSLYFKPIKCVNPDEELMGQGKMSNTSSASNFTTELCENDGKSSASRSAEVNDLICSESPFHGSLCQRQGTPRSISENNLVHSLDSHALVINTNILPSNTFLAIESVEDAGRSIRYIFVEDLPPIHNCRVSPKIGIELQDSFRLQCFPFSHKNVFLSYKVVFERENEDGTRLADIFFQAPLKSMTFQLPSGYKQTVKYSLKLWIENERGVAREYCSMVINVLSFNPGPTVTVEEYLYNRSMLTMDMFHGHKYAFHGPTLHNVTILAEVLNRQPKVSRFSSKFHLRTEIRKNLINILNWATVAGEYDIRQFSTALKSCTRVPEELNYFTTVTAIEILKKILTIKMPLLQRRTGISKHVRDHFVGVASKLFEKIAGLGGSYLNKIMTETLESLFKVILLSTTVNEPPISFTETTFHATLFKLHSYRDENISLSLGDTHISFLTNREGHVVKPYYIDIFGGGVQAVTLNLDQFNVKGNSFFQVTPVLELKKYNFKGEDGSLDTVNLKVQFPRRDSKTKVLSTRRLTNYRITPREIHRFTFNKSSNSALEIELRSVTPILRKFHIKIYIRCTDQHMHNVISESAVVHNYPFKKTFVREELENCNGQFYLLVNIESIISPNRVEKQNTVINYTVIAWWTKCLSRDIQKKKWSERSCKLVGDPSVLVECSCDKSSRELVGATKQSPFVFEKEPILSENNVVMCIVVILSLLFVITVAALLLFEKLELARQRSCFVLAPSDPSHTHKYQVTVFTGHVFGAGTTAKVALVLYGEQNSSYPVELFIENQPLFRRSSRDIFLISARQNLGRLTKIHLWHDNTGHSPSWFVEKLIIKDLVTEEKWMFKCCRWLAVDKENKKIDCKVAPYDGQLQLSFKEFRFVFGKKLLDIHLWLSLVTMPSYSLFRRSERFTSCILILFSYLCLNAHFCQSWDILNLDCISIFNPTWQNFEIGSTSSLIIFPLNLLITILFRFTRKRSSQTKGVPRLNISSRDKLTRKEENKANHAPLDRCASVMQELHYRSKRYMLRNKVHPFSNSDKLDVTVDEMDDSILQVKSELDTCCDNNKCQNPTSTDSSLQYDLDYKNSDQEITSQGSGSYTDLQSSEKARLPACFSIFMWVAVVTSSVNAAYLTILYTKKFDILALICYWQCVLWSLILSFCVLQPFQAFVFTVMTMLHRRFSFQVIAVNDPGENMRYGSKAVMITDSTNSDTIERNVDDGTNYQKSLYLKYLQPLPSKELAKSRISLRKKNKTFVYIRDLFLYTFLLVLLYAMTSSADRQSIFLHNQGMKDLFTRQTNISSFSTWWATCPQKMLDTLEFNQVRGTISAFHGRMLVIGHPKLKITMKYCKNMFKEKIIYQDRNCTIYEVEKRITSLHNSMKNNWIHLNNITRNLNQHVKKLSMQLVLYSPALNVFSVVQLSSQIVMGSSLEYGFKVKTFRFFVDGSGGNVVHTVHQVLFSLLLILMTARQVFCTQKKKFCLDFQFLILILSLFCFVVMWIWIKSQYAALILLNDMWLEVDLTDVSENLHGYQECLWLFMGLLQFFVFIKICELVGFGKILTYNCVIFSETLKLVLMQMFCLVVILTSFAQMGVLLFGDYVENFSSFVDSFSFNVMYLREKGTANLFPDNREQQTVVALYTVSFCICVVLISYLIKAAFIQAYSSCIHALNKKELSFKAILFTPLKRIRFLIAQYRGRSDHNEQPYTIPLRYVLKEVNEQLDEIEFRLVNLFSIENMPPKQVRISSSSSSESIDEVKFVYKVKDEVIPNYLQETTSTSTEDELSSLEYRNNTSCTSSCNDQNKQLGKDSERKAESISTRKSTRFSRDFPKPNGSCFHQVDQSQGRLYEFNNRKPYSPTDNKLQGESKSSTTSTDDKQPFLNSHKFRRPTFPLPISDLIDYSTKIENEGSICDNLDCDVFKN